MNHASNTIKKLRLLGAPKLSDAELLSIIIGADAQQDPLVVASNILAQSKGAISNLVNLSEHDFVRSGTAAAGALRAQAAIELGKRVERSAVYIPNIIKSNEDVIKAFRPRLAGLSYEEFWVLYLSPANTILSQTKISQGGAKGTAVDPKIVIKKALDILATGIILVHNHPSGLPLPSEEDKEVTQKIIDAANFFDLTVLDHLIITSGDSYSFRKHGLIM